jgi:hypothetical protein
MDAAVKIRSFMAVGLLGLTFHTLALAAGQDMTGRWHARTQNSQGGSPMDFTLILARDTTYSGVGQGTAGTGFVKADFPITVTLTQTGDLIHGSIGYKERASGKDCVGEIVIDGVRQGDVITGSTIEDMSCGKNAVRGGTIQLNRLPEPRGRKVNSKDGLSYVMIPAGTLRTACAPKDPECSAHDLSVVAFWMGETEVPQSAYQRVAGANPSNYQGANHPVESVTWDEAAAYCKLTGMRLPTIQEWEYAAHGADPQSRYGDLGDVAHYWGNHTGMGPHDVGLKEPNAYALYDVLGNVWEWTADLDAAGKHHVRMGGSWFEGEKEVSVSGSYKFPWRVSDDRTGFRCVGE